MIMKQIHLTALVLITVALAASCTSTDADLPGDYQTVADYPTRDTTAAERENAAAVALLEEGNYPQAEERIKKALKADITYGPAHNNLGKVYYLQEKYYLAAWEFRYAIKLMPHQPEPFNNLGLVFEAVGKLDEAVEQYEHALELQPDNPQIIGNTARARYRRGDRGQDVRKLLAELISKDTRPAWTDWAREKLAMISSKTSQQE